MSFLITSIFGGDCTAVPFVAVTTMFDLRTGFAVELLNVRLLSTGLTGCDAAVGLD